MFQRQSTTAGNSSNKQAVAVEDRSSENQRGEGMMAEGWEEMRQRREQCEGRG